MDKKTTKYQKNVQVNFKNNFVGTKFSKADTKPLHPRNKE